MAEAASVKDVPAAPTAPAAPAASADDKSKHGDAVAAPAAAQQGGEVAAEPKPLLLTVLIPGCKEPMKISVLPADTVFELRQWVSDLPTTFYLTCFALEFESKKLNDFVELAAVPGLKSGSALRVVKDVYTERAVRAHVRRLRDLIGTTKAESVFAPSPLSPENLSPALVPSLLRAATEPEIPEVFTKPHPAVISNLFSPLLSAPSYECLKSIKFSSWNPPTRTRAMFGDLAYIVVTTLENRTLHITAHTHGFYVNRSTDTVFSPQEHASYPSNAHDLVTLLRGASSKFTTDFAAVSKAMSDRHPFEVLSSPNRVFQWLVPELPVHPDAGRAEDFALGASECDASNPGVVREWNSELQELREMPAETAAQRLLRDRHTARFHTDFVAASLRGAQSIVHGNVPALNPNDEASQRIYLWNNIFFSFAMDARDSFKTQGGHAAAHAAAAADLHGIAALMQTGLGKLSVLGTVIIDYAGHRIVAQAIVPGIVRRDPSQTIIHGALDLGTPVQVHETFSELLAASGSALRIRPHKIRNGDGTEVTVQCSAEVKGMKGSDDRLYVLDLFRLMPRDPSFVYEDGSTEVRHGVYTFRQELVSAFNEHLVFTAVRQRVAEQQEKIVKAKESKEAAAAAAGEAGAEAAVGEKDGAATAVATTGDAQAKDKGDDDKLRAEISLEGIDTFMYNPDALTTFVSADTEEEKEADLKTLKDLSSFLLEGAIPRFLVELVTSRPSILDGASLTEAMHKRGINMRYLGLLLQRLDEVPQTPAFAKKLLLMELLSRVAKFHLRAVLANMPAEWLNAAIAHFLNCYLGNVIHAPDWVDFASGRAHSFPILGSKKKAVTVKPCPPAIVAEMTSASLWASLQATAKLHFRFALPERKALVAHFSTGKLAMLRSICLKTGVQVFCKDYMLGSPLPFTPADIAGLVPVIKAIPPASSDGATLHERALLLLSQGNMQGCAFLDEAVALMTQVHGPLHPAVASALRTLGQLHFQSDDVVPAVELLERATIAIERCCGVDSVDLIPHLLQLASVFNSVSMPVRSLVCLHHARRIIGISFGEDHPDVARIDQHIATVLLGAGKSEEALALFRSNSKVFEGRATSGLELAMSYELTARAAHESKDTRAAVNYQRQAASEFERRLGKEDPRTRESFATLSAFTKDAVEAELLKKKSSPLPDAALRSTSGQKSARFNSDTRSLAELVDYINGAPAKSKAGKKKKARAAEEMSQ